MFFSVGERQGIPSVASGCSQATGAFLFRFDDAWFGNGNGGDHPIPVVCRELIFDV